jgi:hypothetical protein
MCVWAHIARPEVKSAPASKLNEWERSGAAIIKPLAAFENDGQGSEKLRLPLLLQGTKKYALTVCKKK